MVAASAAVTLTGLTVTHHAGQGSGIASRGTLTVVDSIVRDNDHWSFGGGIRSMDGTLTITNSTISGNQSDMNGGGIFHTGGPLTIRGSTISGNTARRTTAIGGGIITGNGTTATIVNSTVSGNTANGEAGGISNAGGTLTIVSSTITDNHAPVAGGLAGVATLTNTILAGNTPTDCWVSPLTDGGSNLVGTGCNGLIDGKNGTMAGTPEAPLDPLLGPLADNGGPTWTHALLPGSPAIGTGRGEVCADAATVAGRDQRGETRPAGPYCDIGAYDTALPATSLPPARVLDAYSQTLPFDEGTGPYTFALRAGTIPPGMNLDADGTLSGTPQRGGDTFLIVTVTDSAAVVAVRAYTLTVERAPATLTLSDLTHTYDGNPKAATVTTDPPGLSGVAVTYDGHPAPPTRPGAYAVEASLSHDLYAAAPVTETLTIAKADLTVTADSHTIMFGDPLPTLSYDLSSTVPAGLIGGTPECSTIATSASRPGTYPIDCTHGTLDPDYFNVKFVAGTLEITHPVVTITADSHTIAYGDPIPLLTYRLSGTASRATWLPTR